MLSSEWFSKSTNKNTNDKILIFNLTGEREPVELMKIIEDKCNISSISFTPNTPFCNDNLNVNNSTSQTEMEKLNKVKEIFEKCQEAIKRESRVYPSVLDCLNHVAAHTERDDEVDVFVTGSIHLIGATLLALERFSKC